eukprot:57592-Pleurochrysis_carterae.AAC.2
MELNAFKRRYHAPGRIPGSAQAARVPLASSRNSRPAIGWDRERASMRARARTRAGDNRKV